MSDSNGREQVRRKMTRCPEGHIFDAAAHGACPTCGARAETPPAQENAHGENPAPRPAPDPAPSPAWLRPALIGGAAIIGVLIVALLLRGAPGGKGDQMQIASKDAVVEARDEKPTGGIGVERWQTVMMIGARKYVCVNETQPDGRYRLGDGCPAPFAGETGTTTVNPDGSWVTRSDAGRVDSGTLEAISEDKVIAHTRGGPVVWERVKN